MPQQTIESPYVLGVVLGKHDPLRERQFNMWWRTSVIGPTHDTAGVLGNDFPGGYVHDAATSTEHTFFADAEIDWRYARAGIEVVSGQVVAGIFSSKSMQGRLHAESRWRLEAPSRWEAVRRAIAFASSYLPQADDVLPAAYFDERVQAAFGEATDPTIGLMEAGGRTGFRMYTKGSSEAWADEKANHLELLAQSDIAWGLSRLPHAERTGEQSRWLEHLIALMGDFYSPKVGAFSNVYPLEDAVFEGGNVVVGRAQGRERTNAWYHTYHHARLAEVALTEPVPWLGDLRTAIDNTVRIARQSHYLFPLFWWLDNGDAYGGADDPGSAGSFAWMAVRGWDLYGDDSYLEAAEAALSVLLRRDVNAIYGESTLMARAAWAAAAIAERRGDRIWSERAIDFAAAALRMMYWRGSHAGMFQACCGMCYPAFFENVGVMLALDFLLDEPSLPIRRALELQVAANRQFFVEQGSAVPLESLPTLEYPFGEEVGHEIYAVGEALNLPYLLARLHGAPALDVHSPATIQRSWPQ